MNQEIKRLLYPTVQELVDRLESIAETDILVLPTSARPAIEQPHIGVSSQVSSCQVDEFGATIYVPNLRSPNGAGMIHELLHLQRLWIEEIPQVFPAKGLEDDMHFAQLVEIVENSLEHLSEIQRERLYVLDTREYWHEVYLQKVDSD